MSFVFSSASQEKLIGVNPELIKVLNKSLELTPMDFCIVQGVRTQEYQDKLYAQGRTEPGKIVTWTKDSRHIGGFAIDFAAMPHGVVSWNDSFYASIAEAIKQASVELNIPIVWGGDWKTKDWGHIELNSDFYPVKGV